MFVKCAVVGLHIGRQDHGTTDFQDDGAHVVHFGIRCEIILSAGVCEQIDIGDNGIVLIGRDDRVCLGVVHNPLYAKHKRIAVLLDQTEGHTSRILRFYVHDEQAQVVAVWQHLCFER
ncbi:hypothetical protein BGV50_28545 [Burkholderia ubonensis]|nr:hypothetical protein BGV50_28545 [Burkholderia ubonensis]